MSKTPVDDGDESMPADAPSSEPIEPESEAPAPEDGATPAPARRRSRSVAALILEIVSLLMAAALVASAAYSYQTIQATNRTLNETRLALAHEQSAHRSADAQASGLSACVAALNADEASLTKLSNDLTAVQARSLKAGDLEAARLTYEAALLKALTDEHKAVVAASWASTPDEWTAVNMLGLQGENEMKQAAALKSQLDSLVTDYQASADEVYAEGQIVAAQVSKTADLCGVGPGSSVAPASPRVSPSGK
jgi:rhamnose utilization protein RhaD (predicted bifunctional aldolase and dehydrogenase)